MLVYRPEYYGIMQDDNGNNTEGLVDLIFAKGRNIGTGVLPLKFEKEYTRFSDPTDYGNNFISIQSVETSEAFQVMEWDFEFTCNFIVGCVFILWFIKKIIEKI